MKRTPVKEHHVPLTVIKESDNLNKDHRKVKRRGNSITAVNDIHFVNPLLRYG